MSVVYDLVASKRRHNLEKLLEVAASIPDYLFVVQQCCDVICLLGNPAHEILDGLRAPNIMTHEV